MKKVDYRIYEKQGFCIFSGDKVINYGDIEKIRHGS